MDEELFVLRRDREWDKFMNQDIVLIASEDRCEAHAKELKDYHPYNVTQRGGLIRSSWFMGECTWRAADSANER